MNFLEAIILQRACINVFFLLLVFCVGVLRNWLFKNTPELKSWTMRRDVRTWKFVDVVVDGGVEVALWNWPDPPEKRRVTGGGLCKLAPCFLEDFCTVFASFRLYKLDLAYNRGVAGETITVDQRLNLPTLLVLVLC
jgi:hypothetical protein